MSKKITSGTGQNVDRPGIFSFLKMNRGVVLLAFLLLTSVGWASPELADHKHCNADRDTSGYAGECSGQRLYSCRIVVDRDK